MSADTRCLSILSDPHVANSHTITRLSSHVTLLFVNLPQTLAPGILGPAALVEKQL